MAVMEGRARAAKRELQMPWLTEFFARQTRLKAFDTYLSSSEQRAENGSEAVVAMLQAMKERGADITIKRVERPN